MDKHPITRSIRTASPVHPSLPLFETGLLVVAVVVGMGIAHWPPLAALILFLMAGVGFAALYLNRPWRGITLIFLVKASLDNAAQGIDITTGLNANGLMNVLIVLGAAGYLLFFRLTALLEILRLAVVRWFILFLGMALFSLTYSPFREAGIRDWVRLTSAFALFILSLDAFRQTSNPRAPIHLLHAMLFSATIPIIVALGQAITGSGYSLTAGYNRLYGTFWHPNGLAFYMGQIGLLALSALVFSTKRSSPRLVYATFAVLSVLVLVLTFTRIAWGAFMVGVFLLMLFRRYPLTYLIIAFVIIAFLAITPLRDRFSDLAGMDWGSLSTVNILPGYNVSALFTNSLHFRIYMWASTFPLFLQQPILGHGWGSFNQLALSAAGIQEAAHNDYWRIVIELGIAGLIIYLGLVGSLLVSCLRIRRQQVLPVRVLIDGFIVSFVFHLIAQFTDNLFEYQTLMWYVWGTAGVVLAQAPISRQAFGSHRS